MNDLTGRKFNRLTVLRRNGSSNDKRAMWLCECDCGNEITAVGRAIKDGKIKSCGCLKQENLCSRAEDLTGKKFGRLTVLGRADDYIPPCGSPKVRWRCLCDCGNETIIVGAYLRNGTSKSCGCLQRELLSEKTKKHGMTDSRLYAIWCGMKQRCQNENSPEYESYGGRGITVCDEWLHNFQAFYDWSMANGYKENLTIERKDVNGNYCPENCCWITKKMQSRNRTDNHKITCKGQTMILTDWANLLGVNRGTLAYKLKNSDLSETEVIENLLKETEVQP